MKSFPILIGSLLLLSFAANLEAERELRPYRLINADKLFVDRVEDEYLTRLNGNVNFFYGDTEFFSDQAELYEVKKIARLFGNVKVVEDSLTLYADLVEYHRITEEIFLTGSVYIREDHNDGTERIFRSDKGEYHREGQKIYAFDNIFFHDEREQINGYSQYLDYDLASGYGFITGDPKIVVVGEEDISISGQRIEFYRDFNRLAASFDVLTVYEEYTVNSDFLLFFMDEEYAVFLGEPALQSDFADARADKFFLYFEERKIASALLEDNCEVFFAAKEGGEKENRINCSLMELYFEEGKISEMQAFDNVKSFYVSAAAERDYFNNAAQSEKLTVKINRDNEIESVVFRGRVTGKYRFSDKIIDRSVEDSE